MHKWSQVRHYKGVGLLAVLRMVHFHLIELHSLLFLLLDDHGSVLLELGLRTWMVYEFSLIMLWSRTDQTFRVYYHAVFEEEYTVGRHDISLLGRRRHIGVGVHLVVCPLRLGGPVTLATPRYLSGRRRA